MPKKKRKKYTMSDIRIKSDLLKTNWSNRMEIMTLRNQGWSFQKIADKLEVSKQAVNEVYLKTEKLTTDQLESLQREYA